MVVYAHPVFFEEVKSSTVPWQKSESFALIQGLQQLENCIYAPSLTGCAEQGHFHPMTYRILRVPVLQYRYYQQLAHRTKEKNQILLRFALKATLNPLG